MSLWWNIRTVGRLLAKSPGKFESRRLGSVLWAVGRLGIQCGRDDRFDAVPRRAMREVMSRGVGSFALREVANVMWGCGMCRFDATELHEEVEAMLRKDDGGAMIRGLRCVEIAQVGFEELSPARNELV
jgi:hypothetical protein